MKRINFAIGLLITLVIQSGCNQTTESQPTTAATNAPAVSQTGTPAQAASYAYETDSKKKGDTGLCVICVVDEGSTMEEEAIETIDYEGKTYLFCNEAEKATFISEPAKYAVK